MLGNVAPSPAEKFGHLRELGVRCCHLWLGKSVLGNGLEQKIADITLRDGYEITTVFCGFDGERYDDIPTVRSTIGLVPEEPRAARVAEMKQVADVAKRLGAPAIALHIGYIPPDRKSDAYKNVVKAAQEVADHVDKIGLKLTLETGQETAAHLKDFIGDVGRSNLGVNFDPANMLLYGNDKPIAALEVLAPYLFNVHAKDGDWPTEQGKLGAERPIGKGQVNFPEFIRKLKKVGYRGPLIIEREISGDQQLADMRSAITFLKKEIQS